MLISDRNTIKVHGLQTSMKFYDNFHPNLIDVVYCQAIADEICEYQENPDLGQIFNDNEEAIR